MLSIIRIIRNDKGTIKNENLSSVDSTAQWPYKAKTKLIDSIAQWLYKN